MDAVPRPSCTPIAPARVLRRRSTTTSLVVATLLVSGLLVGAGGGAATAGPRTAPAATSATGSTSSTTTSTSTASTTSTTTATPTASATVKGATRTGQGQGKKPSPTATASPTTAPTTTAPTASPSPTVAPTTTAPTTTAPTTSPSPTVAPTATATSTPAPTTPAPVASTTAPTTASPSPTPTVAGARTTLPLPRSTWTRPTLVDPIVWRPSVTDTTLRNAGDRDVLVVWPDTPLDVEGGFQINGGRNIVSVGGTIQPSRRYFAPGETTPNDNRCLYIGGSSTPKAPRTIHVEGLHCAGAFVWEGINIDSKAERGTLTVQLRDVRIDQVNVDLPGGLGNHYGGDALQSWNGPHQLRIDGFTAKKLAYQGFFFQPFSFGSGTLGRWDLRNIQLEGASTGSAYLLWLSDSTTTPLAYGMEGTFVQPSPGDTRSTTIWHSGTDFTAATIGAPVEDIVGFAHVGPFANKG